MDALTRLRGQVRESAGSENNAKNEIFSEKSSLSVTFGTFGDLPLLTLYTPESWKFPMKTIRMRIELTSEQRKVVDHNIDANRLVYNSLITACKNVHRKTGRLPTVFDLNKLGTRMRHNHGYISDAYSTTLNATSKRVIKACEKTLDGKRPKGKHKAESTAEEDPQESKYFKYRYGFS